MNLNSPVTAIPTVGPSYAARLENLDIHSVYDLLNHIPSHYLDYRSFSPIARTQIGQMQSVKATIKSVFLKASKGGRRMTLAEITDDTGSMLCVWFNQPFLVQILKKGSEIVISGKVDFFGQKKAFIAPVYENGTDFLHTGRLVPVYPQTKGITSKWLRSKVKKVWDTLAYDIEEVFDQEDLKEYDLLNLKEAYQNIHFPDTPDYIERAKRRLGFNEFFILHLQSLLRKKEWQKVKPTLNLKIKPKDIAAFKKALPFELTPSQIRSINEVLSDMSKDIPMNRLLEGDVGSGKTVVAAAACYGTFCNGFQSVIMAPTQILANQHYQTLKTLFKDFPISIALITSDKKVIDEKPHIFVGTHALLHKDVHIESAALVVIDEQHRFGVEQRAHLTKLKDKKRFAPHSLTMTATPIPRTVALTAYGDLVLSTLDTLPKGRQPITTWIVTEQKRAGAYEWIKKQIKETNTQVYIVCPFIEDSEAEGLTEVKSVQQEFTQIKNIFRGFKVGLLHGRIKGKEKDKILSDFRDKKYDILVSTPVIEVGIDVPNASIMIIENAERFGLAQLHQLRGRIGRGETKSYCLIFSPSKTDATQKRLAALKSTMSGFELAEFDLKMRGPGELFGSMQSGYLDVKYADWSDTQLLRQTKELAEKIAKKSKNYKELIERYKLMDISIN